MALRRLGSRFWRGTRSSQSKIVSRLSESPHGGTDILKLLRIHNAKRSPVAIHLSELPLDRQTC
jgi:hypothetical protein